MSKSEKNKLECATCLTIRQRFRQNIWLVVWVLVVLAVSAVLIYVQWNPVMAYLSAHWVDWVVNTIRVLFLLVALYEFRSWLKTRRPSRKR
jgi:multisubunit Na+/H+ antiporter MnhB subunit